VQNEDNKQTGMGYIEDQRLSQHVYTCFVTCPFGEAYDELFKKCILALPTALPNHKLIIDRADKDIPGTRLLETNVFERINHADFIIADISGLNPNVMIELGYSISCGKPVIVIVEESTEDMIPIDLKGNLYIEYEASEAGFRLLWQQLVTRVQYTIGLLDVKSIKDQYHIICHRNRAVVMLGEKLKAALRRIDILTTNVDYFAKCVFNEIKTALDTHTNLTVRILTLDPESDITARRAVQLGWNIYHYRKQLHESIRSLLLEFKDYEDRFQLRLYDDLPTQVMFRIDDIIVTSVVSVMCRSRENLHFELDTNQPGVLQSFVLNFETIWIRSRTSSANI
jgi:hypothetical protein